jgi:hypothetical protein
MNNNPVNSIDPTGGCETGNCPTKLDDVKGNEIYTKDGWVSMLSNVGVGYLEDRMASWSDFAADFRYLMSNIFALNGKRDFGLVFYGAGAGNLGGAGKWSELWQIYVLDANKTIAFLNLLGAVGARGVRLR